MKAIQIQSPGGPESLVLTDVPDPRPAPGDVVIDVVAAGLNRADVNQRKGHYPPPPGESELPGLEVSGRISAVGDGVDGFEVGEPVCALLAGGGYAEKVAVPAGQVLPVPAGVDVADAAGLPETVATVYSNLYLQARLQPGETVLVHGGAGGIGTTAIQLGTALGSPVYVTASSAQKIEASAQLGAVAGIDYTGEDFVERIHDLTDGRGVDVILDVVGGAYLDRNLRALAPNGRLVIIATQQGSRAELNIGRLMSKRASVIGTTLRARPRAEKAEIMAAVREHVWPLIEAGRLTPLIDRRFPLTEAAAAHEYFDSGSHIGKVLLTTGA
ncbi:NAD(P)H-quinone oxidoreductase [Tersicoccus phoenicis]|uniref:NAD(P)H-quinone oxidoreductase n=1 Tax=Tersicoccus phoenicis TaxID=554083 RepID=A0A1R1L7Z9_9MICC|nr:NAD(P)H-quinone oxidoreductase [Tersicoccus phoenicis]OMH23672.1 NAD(P)H-quinone oxidoreductase [Tersicoccus phoenicis]